jgi:hypothetical protein
MSGGTPYHEIRWNVEILWLGEQSFDGSGLNAPKTGVFGGARHG